LDTSLDPLDPAAQARMLETPSVLHYLPWALLYPWRGFAWVSLALLGGGLWLMSVSAGSVVYTLGCLGAALQYLFTVLGRTIDGRATPPPIAQVLAADAESARFQALCAAAVAIGAACATWLPTPSAELWVALCVFALPACAVVIALGADLFEALDPRRWWTVMQGAGRWYPVFALLVALVLTQGGARHGLFLGTDVTASDAPLRSLDAAGLGLILLAVYLATVAMHLLGVVVHRQHQALGLHVSQRAATDAEREAAQLARAVERVMPGVWTKWDAGDQAGAERLLVTATLVHGLEHPHLERLFAATLARRGQGRLCAAVGRRLISELLRRGMRQRALEVATLCLDRQPGFTAANLEQQLALLEAAWQGGQGALAERLRSGLLAERPDAAARVADLAARLRKS
jgi:hypothetical protein